MILGSSQVLMLLVFRKGSLIESSYWGCFSHVTIAESLQPSLWVALINVGLERKGRGDFGLKSVLGICLETKGKTVARVELVLAGELLCLKGDFLVVLVSKSVREEPTWKAGSGAGS